MVRSKTWRLIYPDKTESLMNYNPLDEEKRKRDKEWLKALKTWLYSNEDYIIQDGLVIRLRREVMGILKSNEYKSRIKRERKK